MLLICQGEKFCDRQGSVWRGVAGDVDEGLRFAGGVGSDGLQAAPTIEDGDLMDAGNGAVRRAGFFGVVLAVAAFGRVFRQRNSGIAALLRTVVHQSVLADIKITRAGPAAPSIFASGGDIVLEGIDAREGAFAEAHDFLENGTFVGVEGAELAVAVMDDADGG